MIINTINIIVSLNLNNDRLIQIIYFILYRIQNVSFEFFYVIIYQIILLFKNMFQKFILKLTSF